MHFAGLDGALESFPVRVRHHQHSATRGVLSDDYHRPSLLIEADGVEVEAHVKCHAHETAPAVAVMPAGMRISRTVVASFAFVAIASPPNAVGVPRQSVNTPPASSIIGISAAASQSDTTSSTMMSARPVATRR